MSAQDKTEQVLKQLHTCLANGEVYKPEPSKVLVNKNQMQKLLNQLNQCMYEMMEEYELTRQTRDRSERDFRKQGQDIVEAAEKRAEDVYAASVLYSDEALAEVMNIMKEASSAVEEVYTQMQEKMSEKQRDIRKNQTDLKGQLQTLRDTETYMNLIEARNREKERAKQQLRQRLNAENKSYYYGNRQSDVRVNHELLKKMGMDSAPMDAAEDYTDTAAGGTGIPVSAARTPETLPPEERHDEFFAPEETSGDIFSAKDEIMASMKNAIRSAMSFATEKKTAETPKKETEPVKEAVQKNEDEDLVSIDLNDTDWKNK